MSWNPQNVAHIHIQPLNLFFFIKRPEEHTNGVSTLRGFPRDFPCFRNSERWFTCNLKKKRKKKRKEMKLQLEETSKNVSSFRGFYGKS